jgi:peptide/nickel transport system substrate-binding protein
LTLELKALPEYSQLANQIKDLWAKIGIKTNVKIIDTFPSDFQVFLGEFNVSKDPDQYALWHSSQPNNITHYVNLRIDKLLEDGRQTVDTSARQKIYADFQKYLLDDPPATFLYFPYEYDITRK